MTRSTASKNTGIAENNTVEGQNSDLQGGKGVQYINREYRLIDAEAYLLSGSCYVELNPVRANRVNHPSEYPWSS
jgi:hypothetical protein